MVAAVTGIAGLLQAFPIFATVGTVNTREA